MNWGFIALYAGVSWGTCILILMIYDLWEKHHKK
jgi:hypothetical protein